MLKISAKSEQLSPLGLKGLKSYHVYIYIDRQAKRSYTRYVTLDVLCQAEYIWALRKELIVFVSILPCYYYELAFDRVL